MESKFYLSVLALLVIWAGIAKFLSYLFLEKLLDYFNRLHENRVRRYKEIKDKEFQKILSEYNNYLINTIEMKKRRPVLIRKDEFTNRGKVPTLEGVRQLIQKGTYSKNFIAFGDLACNAVLAENDLTVPFESVPLNELRRFFESPIGLN